MSEQTFDPGEPVQAPPVVGSVEAHRQAEMFMGEMDAAAMRGDWLEAARAADAAADLEWQALATIPLDRFRTRAIIAESSGTLRARAAFFLSKVEPNEQPAFVSDGLLDEECPMCRPLACDDPDRHMGVSSEYTPLANKGCRCGADFDGRDCMCFEGD